MDFQVCQPQKTRVLCHLNFVPSTSAGFNELCHGTYIASSSLRVILKAICAGVGFGETTSNTTLFKYVREYTVKL